MKSEIINRKNNEKYTEKSPKSAAFLYIPIVGTLLLAVATRKSVSKVSSLYMNNKKSIKRIKSFIKKNKIDMSDYPKRDYKSFNDFFTREILPGKRPFSKDSNDLISVADSKLLYYKIDEYLEMEIKGKTYTVSELLRDKSLASEYKNGTCLVFRLTVDDYHRYSYIDDGVVIKRRRLRGILHTVGPIAFKRHKVFKQNQREYTIIDTKNFGKVIQMEIGAMLVGRIKNHNKTKFTRCEEKGYFLFGGSTVVVFFKENTVKIDEDIIKNSNEDMETRILLGETIGKKQ